MGSVNPGNTQTPKRGDVMMRGVNGWGPVRSADAFKGNPVGADRFFTGAVPYYYSQYYAKEKVDKHAHYAFVDESVLNYTGNTEPIVGHASSNMNATIAGSLSFNHHHDYQGTGQYGASGTLTRYANFYAQPYNTAGTITDMMQFHASDPIGAGTLTTLYGFYCPNLTKGATRYAFYAGGSTPNYFGGAITTGGLFTVTYAAGGASSAVFSNTTNPSYALVSLDGTGATGGGQFQFSRGGTASGGMYGDATGITLYTGASTIMATADGTNFTIASGKNLKLGNAYVASVQVPTGYIIIYDSAGTAYKVSCNT